MDQQSSQMQLDKNRIKKRRTVFNIAVLLLYISANIFLMLCHEAWRDESQAWIIAKQLSWKQIPGICASEGHPFLWFFLIKISIVLGLPFRYFSVVSIVLMSISAGILLFKSNFHWASKILLILSPMFFYYNPVICRNYSLVMLLVCLLCALWNKRHEKPLLYGLVTALLFQSHVLIFGLAIGCMIDMGCNLLKNKSDREPKHLGGILIPLSSFILMILELKQSRGSKNFINITPDFLLERITGGNWSIRFLSLSFSLDYDNLKIGFIVVIIPMIILALFLFLSFDKRFREQNLSVGLCYLFSLGVYFGIALLIRNLDHIQMAIVLWMIIMFLCWTLREYEKGHLFEIILVFLCVVFIPKSMIIDPYKDITGSYSGSKEIADIVDKNVEDGSLIFVNHDYLTTSVIAYLSDSGKKYVFWDIDNDREFTIHKWGETNPVNIDEFNIAKYADDVLKHNNFAGKAYYIKGNEYLIKLKDNKLLFSGLSKENKNIYVHEIEDNKRLVLIDKNKETNSLSEYYILYKFE